MLDIVVLGELLIDFTLCGYSEIGMRLFEQNAGGAVANLAVAAARLGLRVGFCGKVGRDMHGRHLKETLQREDINLSGLLETDEAFTTLAFVALSDAGERQFSFARKPGADTLLRADELDGSLLTRTRVFHIGSLSLTQEPSRSATWRALNIAKEAGALISYDPNYRASLWDNERMAVEQMRSVLPFVDIMKLSEEEMTLLTGCEEPDECLDALAQQQIRCAVVTCGAQGALARAGTQYAEIPPVNGRVVDTTGAGDAFWGGFLAAFLHSHLTLEALTTEDLQQFGRLGSATASYCIGRRGGIPAMPTRAQLGTFALR